MVFISKSYKKSANVREMMNKAIALYLLTWFSHAFTIYGMVKDNNPIVICGSVMFVGLLFYIVRCCDESYL